ncbi:Hpt domain-containing protein [Methylorubrum extorquens]
MHPILIPEMAMGTAALDEMRELLGEQKTLALLADLATDLRSRFGSGKAEDLASDAHVTISTAGLFGFVDLSNLCREAEEAYRSGANMTLLQARLNEVQQQVLGEIETLRTAA